MCLCCCHLAVHGQMIAILLSFLKCNLPCEHRNGVPLLTFCNSHLVYQFIDNSHGTMNKPCLFSLQFYEGLQMQAVLSLSLSAWKQLYPKVKKSHKMLFFFFSLCFPHEGSLLPLMSSSCSEFILSESL